MTNAAGATTSYSYNKRGQVTSETLPGNNITLWTFDANGRVSSRKDPNGEVIQYTYDTVGRLLKKTYPNNSLVNYTYDGVGNRLSMNDSLGTTLYQYDANNNLVEFTDCFGRKNNYTYDRANKRKSLATSFGTLSYGYDGAGQVTAITDFSGNRITLTYNGDGRITGVNYPEGGSTNISYNQLGQTENINSSTRTGIFYNINHQYNSNNNISLSTVRKIDYSFDNPYNYTYDQLNRLTQVNGHNEAFDRNITYTYDKLGNRLSQDLYKRDNQSSFGSTSTYGYNNLNLLTSRTYKVKDQQTDYSYAYDANGNLKLETSVSEEANYDYDYENRLTKTRYYPFPASPGIVVENLYDGDGRLMGTIADGDKTSHYQYDGNQVIADIDGAGAILANYTRMPSGKLLSMYKYEDWSEERGTYYVFSDDLGSTLMLFGKTSGKFTLYDYDDFGTYSTSGGTDPTRFTFTGMPYFSGPGLYQMGARFYNPAVGRFITRDTYRGNIYQPWTQNLYAYCNNNPVNFVDPTGHFVEDDFNDDDSFKYSDEVFKSLEYCGNQWTAANNRGDERGKEYWHQVADYYRGKGPNPDNLQAPSTLKDPFTYFGPGGVLTGFGRSSARYLLSKGAGKVSNKVTDLAKDMKDWLGKDARVITNKSGDKVFMSGDGTKRIRFDINNTSPHNNPHGHVEELVNGKWVKSGPIYPTDVPHN